MEVSIEYYLLVNLGMNFLTLAAIARCRGQVRWIALICAAAAGAVMEDMGVEGAVDIGMVLATGGLVWSMVVGIDALFVVGSGALMLILILRKKKR